MEKEHRKRERWRETDHLKAGASKAGVRGETDSPPWESEMERGDKNQVMRERELHYRWREQHRTGRQGAV